MRSGQPGSPPLALRGRFRRGFSARPGLLALLTVTFLAVPAVPQYDWSEEPLLATTISERDIDLRGRFVRQWKRPDGTHVLMVNGGFHLEIGARRMAADNAVVWITRRQIEPDGPRFYELTIYLSENAEIAEPGGTVTLDNVLLVRGLRTSGRIVRYQDAHAAENTEAAPLYQQALRDRELFEHGEPTAPEPTTPEVGRPAEIRRPTIERPPRVIHYQLKSIEPAETPTGERVFVSTGGVYFGQEGGPDAPMLEIRADTAVVFPADNLAESLAGANLRGERHEPAATQPTDTPATPEPKPPKEPGPADLGLIGGTGQVRAVYLEGDVVLSLGNRFVRAHRLYYDFERDRALLLDAVFRADIPQRGIPLYVRADEIRQLSAREFAARHAIVTTSEFYTPSYHVGAERIVLRDTTARDADGRATSPIGGEYELNNATANISGIPFLWWPYSQGKLEESETLLRRFRTGYSGEFGAEVETAWYLFNLLGVKPPEGYDATLRLDYFSRRGPAAGVNVDYERQDHFGLLRTYYVHDDGEDDLGPLRRDQEDPSTHERGRVLWRHRHYLPYNWEATLELAYASDPYYLEEYERSEWFEGKEQETLIYLKRAGEVDALTFLANWRLLDFVTQTEHLPEVAYRRIGDTFASPLVLYHESRIGGVRYRPDDRYYFDDRLYNNNGQTDVTARGDARQEAEWPVKLGPLNVVPFASVRGSYWDGQPFDSGGLWRGLGVYGVRGSTSFSRVYDELKSELLDINRIRHIIRPDFAAWWAHSNTRSELITPFDYGIETIDDFYGGTVGLRQTWQTRRGPEENQRTVDLLTFNLEAGFFGNTDGRRDVSNGYANPLRPENSRTRNYMAGDLIYRLSDTTSLLYDFNVDLNDWAFDRHNVSLAVERSPRLAYVFGSRYAGDIHMSLVGGGWNYKLNEKHITTVRGWWDVDTGKLGEISVAYIRKLPRWYVGLSWEYDNVEDDCSVSISVWPEGIPEWTLGSRRFTGLATTTGIRP